MKRLHKQGFSGVGEDVPASLHYAVARKKRLRLLSEVVLRTVKRRLPSSPCGLRRDKCVFVRHFFGKKMAAGFFIVPRHSERHFELKNSEFPCEMKL